VAADVPEHFDRPGPRAATCVVRVRSGDRGLWPDTEVSKQTCVARGGVLPCHPAVRKTQIMTSKETRKFCRIFSAGRLTRGRTTVDVEFEVSSRVRSISSRPHWTRDGGEGDVLSRCAALDAKFEVQSTAQSKAIEDIPWCPEFVLVSHRCRELLSDLNQQVVWAPVLAKNIGRIGPAMLEYFAMLPRHVLSCAKYLESNARYYERYVADGSTRFPGDFQLDVGKVLDGLDIFMPIERPAKIFVSYKVRRCIEESGLKKAYFAATDDGADLPD
jgi:hypothetical protein